jgi:hypothetical protein
VQDGVTLTQGGSVCVWEPTLGPAASSTLDAMANGITVMGVVACPSAVGSIEVTSGLFMDRFPGHENVIRYAANGDYQELAALTSATSTAEVRILGQDVGMMGGRVSPPPVPEPALSPPQADGGSSQPPNCIPIVVVLILTGTLIAIVVYRSLNRRHHQDA